MDECIPPVVRDSAWFMYPFYKIWFKGSNIKEVMNFKQRVNFMSEAEFAELYRNTVAIANDRPTDINESSISEMLHSIDSTAETLLDIGCGRGYWLDLISEKKPFLKTTGLDFYDNVPLKNSNYVKGNTEKLPFVDNSFDIVTCSHVIEHLQNLPTAIAEMKRVARKQIIISTPCQRYYFHTLDLHLHFFPNEFSISSLFALPEYECKKIDGDWLYIAKLA